MNDFTIPIADQQAGRDDHARWVAEIMLYEKEAQDWEKRARDICRRYKDKRNPTEEKLARFNILWSNIQTLLPSVYAKNPKTNIDRSFKDKDPIGRVTADVLERSVSYFVSSESFGRAMRQAVLDRLLSGRGDVWVRYEPYFKDAEVQGNEEVRGEGTQITDDSYPEVEEPLQEVYFEKVCFDYVHWEDIGHTIARTEEEVRAKWRRVYMDREELMERFGEELGSQVPLDYSPRNLNDEKVADDLKKASIYEIWHEKKKEVIWLHKSFPEILDKRPDPLGLADFYCCPVSLLATTANDSLLPVPDYTQYQDQALELDRLTSRIASITRALKVAGVCDASAQGVERLLAEGVENQLIPVDQWAVHSEKGGLKGVMDLMPMLDIAQTLLALYQARDKVKQDLYEVNGIADIIRGSSDPDETAAAQKIKGDFASVRLRFIQDRVQEFARDLVRISAQLIAKHFSIETIKKISGVSLLTNQEKALLQQYMQMQAQQAQQQQMLMQQQQQMAQQPPMQGQPHPPQPMSPMAQQMQRPTMPQPQMGNMAQ